MAALRTCGTTDVQRLLTCLSSSVVLSRLTHKTTVVQAAEKGKAQTDQSHEKEEFRVYEIEGLKPRTIEKRQKRPPKKVPPPRFRSMKPDQDWTNVWPAASTFNWSTVPFPVRQGYIDSPVENDGVIPSKYANLELMKIPNFLHLSPLHIKKHCEALKKFCTPWPEGLETDEKCREHFPLESVTSDYVLAAPTLRDDRARLASIKFHLSDLELDYHAKDKFIRLVEQRYNPDTDEVTLESNSCPLKQQNLNYVMFLLTAVYFESWKRESWESLKELSDMERYFWDINASRKNVVTLLRAIKEADKSSDSSEARLTYLPDDLNDEDTICGLPEVEEYKVAVEEIFNEGENIETLTKYKESVQRLLSLKTDVS